LRLTAATGQDPHIDMTAAAAYGVLSQFSAEEASQG
jgi:hypothetical protein